MCPRPPPPPSNGRGIWKDYMFVQMQKPLSLCEWQMFVCEHFCQRNSVTIGPLHAFVCCFVRLACAVCLRSFGCASWRTGRKSRPTGGKDTARRRLFAESAPTNFGCFFETEREGFSPRREGKTRLHSDADASSHLGGGGGGGGGAKGRLPGIG